MRIIIILLFFISLTARAQEVVTTTGKGVAADTIVVGISDEVVMPEEMEGGRIADGPQLILPTLTEYGTMPTLLHWRGMWGGWNSWNVHEGLNASLGASVFSTFGSHDTYSGMGFSQNIALMYAKPLTDKLSLAAGGYFSNTYWGHNTFRDAGLSAVLGYRFDDHWSAYAYAQKSIVQNQQMPYTLRDLSNLGDRIGAAVRYNFSPSFAIQVSVEKTFNNYSPVYP